MESTRQHLIELLQENEQCYISGQELSTKLHISRTAVWKHMKELEKDGYVIDAKPRKGYKITSAPNKMSQNTLQWGLQTEWLGKSIVHKPTIASTQTLAKQLAATGAEHGTIVIADEQTAGRGRMQRTWHSRKGEGIWMSLILRPEILPNKAPQITLLVATVIAEVLSNFNVKPLIKWPNDILINDKKVSGILTEMQAEQDQIEFMVIGIGLNVNQSKDMFPADLKPIATSLKIQSGQKLDPIVMTQQILMKFEDVYEKYISHGFDVLKGNWLKYGYKLGEKVYIQTAKRQWYGVIEGIEPDGALRIKNDDGSVETLYSAEIKW
ncbi:biotin--[acetyl-CoA-carboxylase] ligase [Aquibacillus koreensis]|uniref:Bifunctional ligase/repressor BirA n=2 Tax=Aquibacillus koreensis TaxID=279446 RepID=A0A9X4AI10_9BACI|nr:biotin--[acetyl-CoA-carboxylase] ligase [Aquibacillus koreensis]MCT2537362.1 biotin--[acetyl-CoA-carboxylase] ligase [Aquibacillus koreensis]MDC3418808.1 biotin--[acetyl-CoA-carboxylase] ligase [Aquibacillus koreensis]